MVSEYNSVSTEGLVFVTIIGMKSNHSGSDIIQSTGGGIDSWSSFHTDVSVYETMCHTFPV